MVVCVSQPLFSYSLLLYFYRPSNNTPGYSDVHANISKQRLASGVHAHNLALSVDQLVDVVGNLKQAHILHDIPRVLKTSKELTTMFREGEDVNMKAVEKVCGVLSGV